MITLLICSIKASPLQLSSRGQRLVFLYSEPNTIPPSVYIPISYLKPYVNQSIKLSYSNRKQATILYINKRLDSTAWKVTERTRDVCTLTINCLESEEEDSKEIVIHNVYNPPLRTENRRSSLPEVQKTQQEHAHSDQMILVDFSLHHGYWGGPEIRQQEQEAEVLIQ